jgi:hypothetical protein
MQAHHGKADFRMLIAQRMHRFHAGAIDVREEKLADTRVQGALHHFGAVVVKLFVVEVGVRVDVHVGFQTAECCKCEAFRTR